MENLYFLLPFVTMLTWAVGDFVFVLIARRESAPVATVWNGAISALWLTLLLPFFDPNLGALSGTLLFLNLALGTLFYLCSHFFVCAMASGSASIAGAIVSCSAVFTAAFSITVLGEGLTAAQTAIITLIMLGIVLCAVPQRLGGSELRGSIDAVCASVGWGAFFAFIKLPITAIGWFGPVYLVVICFPFYALLLAAHGVKFNRPNSLSSLGGIALAALLLRSGDICFYLAITKRYTALVAPVASAYIVLYLVLCRVFLNEKLQSRQHAGIALALAGVLSLSLIW